MAKIRQDEHGIYVYAGGWVFRPVQATKFTVGDTTTARHIVESTLGAIGKGNDREYWQIDKTYRTAERHRNRNNLIVD